MATATATIEKKEKLDPISIALRNASILKMNLEGNSNQTIAECVGLHPGNVAKIIKRAKELLPTAIMEHPKIKEAMEQLPLPLPSRKATVKANGHARNGKSPATKPATAHKRSGKQSAKSPAKGVRVKRQGMSLLDAACIVLQKSKSDRMHATKLVEWAVTMRLWKKQSGKTPYATLWSRILAEIKLGPRASRFRLMSPGKFGLTACGKAWKAGSR